MNVDRLFASVEAIVRGPQGGSQYWWSGSVELRFTPGHFVPQFLEEFLD
jgi:hypothetical protein